MSMSTGGSTDRWSGNTSRTLGAIATSFAFCFLLLTFYIVIRYIFIQRLRRRAAAAPEPPKLGLDPSVIASLPTFTYQKSSGGCSSCKQDEWSSTECAICLSVVDEGEVLRLLPNCSHVFHRECIDMWLDSNATCPVCRATADPNNPSISAALTAPPL